MLKLSIELFFFLLYKLLTAVAIILLKTEKLVLLVTKTQVWLYDGKVLQTIYSFIIRSRLSFASFPCILSFEV